MQRLIIRDAGAGEVEFACGEHVAYGVCDVAAENVMLIHAPDQQSMDEISKVLDRCTWSDLSAAVSVGADEQRLADENASR